MLYYFRFTELRWNISLQSKLVNSGVSGVLFGLSVPINR